MKVAKSLELSVRQNSTLKRVRDRIPTYLVDFLDDPRWLPMFVLARLDIARNIHRRRTSSNNPPAVLNSSLFTIEKSRIVEALQQEGLFRQLNLPPAVAADIRNFAECTPCFGNHDRKLDLLPAEHVSRSEAANPITSGHYFERVGSCSAIMAVQADPLLHATAADYLGPGARVISTRLWWSFPLPAQATPPEATLREMLHFDLDDWRMLKFFFYLTPVDPDSGPHLYIRGSHRKHRLKHQISPTVGRPIEEVLESYGAENLVCVHGDAGTGFAEDSYGFHAGRLARTGSRLMLEIAFGVTKPNRRRFFGERVL